MLIFYQAKLVKGDYCQFLRHVTGDIYLIFEPKGGVKVVLIEE